MTFGLSESLKVLGLGRDLSAQETSAAVAEIMAGEAPEALISAFLTALHVKGESTDELTGAVQAIRDRMSGWDLTGLPSPLMDTCGTGGDGANTVNISTAAAIVVAACGVPIAKHGNRSASGNSGSAEVLAELGVDVDAEETVVRRCLIDAGITFLFAPKYHPALRFAGPVRRQLPFRTLFNLIGPLANPARPDFQLVGVPGERQAELVASALARLGSRRAAVVTGTDGLDEVTLGGLTRVRWVESGVVTFKTWQADDFGLAATDAGALRVSGPPESAALITRFLAGEPGPVRAMVLANSAAALLVAGVADTVRNGVERASKIVDSGAAAQLLERWRRISRSAP
ncbi:anthranilate phosphoribosyltransferase [Singulisphaera sp. GP187]|uniref:anthranilate phosphoribosyltransferase n=1 Tax=Singulisphaera sp. GP187 TaxID=1882752 RepID=UPI000929ED09|nr:anthranilate phosphoribosyltransferase [Singulisphaera sp. GP187]SIN80450.1 anthranilate phosphoribosyltransferase [Singulisphaera sp. GP187]